MGCYSEAASAKASDQPSQPKQRLTQGPSLPPQPPPMGGKGARGTVKDELVSNIVLVLVFIVPESPDQRH